MIKKIYTKLKDAIIIILATLSLALLLLFLGIRSDFRMTSYQLSRKVSVLESELQKYKWYEEGKLVDVIEAPDKLRYQYMLRDSIQLYLEYSSKTKRIQSANLFIPEYYHSVYRDDTRDTVICIKDKIQ